MEQFADIINKPYVLITGHRRESFGAPLENICKAIKMIAEQCQDRVHIIYPVHLNPEVQTRVYAALEGQANISLIEPLEYRDFVYLMKKAYLILRLNSQ